MFSRSLVKPILLFSACLMSIIIAFQALTPSKKEKSLVEAACTFANLEPQCFESNETWKEGLAYYDSVLAISHDTISAVKSLFWEHWQLKFAGADHAQTPEVILPTKILEEKNTSCVGVSWLALMLAEVRGIQAQAYLIPGHMYFSVNGRNFEPNREGFNYSHEEYRKKYAAGSWDAAMQKALYRNQFLGIVAFNLGNAKLESDPQAALAWYKVAAEFFPAYPKIRDNRRIALRKLDERK